MRAFPLNLKLYVLNKKKHKTNEMKTLIQSLSMIQKEGKVTHTHTQTHKKKKHFGFKSIHV